VDARQGWGALHAELAAARTAIDAGDRSQALQHVDAALAIDPNFVAAHWLRDQLLAPTGSSAPTTDRAPATNLLEVSERSDEAPVTSAIGFGHFEERVRRRRVERRIDAAHVALEQGQLEDAQAAINELIALAPDLPELSQLTARLEELHHPAAASTHRGHGRWLAAAVFMVTVFGLWGQGELPVGERGRPVATLTPAPIEGTTSLGLAEPSAPDQYVNTPADKISTSPAAHLQLPVARIGTPAAPVVPPQQLIVAPGPIEERPVVAAIGASAAPAPAPTPSAPSPAAAVPVVPVTPVIPVIPVINDERLVEQALQRYRRAYEGLDAPSAQAVYPAVNEPALARAFDGLVSQSLVFDACEIQLLGGSATATCRGTARYVAKVGKREPVSEPRLWSFTLRKGPDNWIIEKARVSYFPTE
jgi:tetratricopeptide (TPR) repeat protein